MGYQFGDFAVQVQGGTSAFVAFSQQGAQLAGILPMIAGPLGMSMKMAVGLSAALGILIPIGSAVARMYFDMKDKTKDAAEEAQTLNGKLKGLNGTLSDYANTLAAIDAGVSINELFASRGIKAAEQELKDATATLEKYVGFVNLALEGKAIGTMGPVAAVGALVGIGFATLSKEQEAAAIEKVRKAEETLTELRAMETANKLKAHTAAVSGMQNELELARVIARHGKDSSEAKAAALAQELRLRLESVQAQVTLNNYTQPEADDLKAQIREVAALLAAGTKAAETGQQKALRLSQDDLEIQRLKNDILRSHNAEGEKTRATLTLEAHLAGEIVRIKQEQKFLEGGITAAEQAQIDNLVAAAIGAEHLNQKIEAGVDSAKELADALSQAASAMGQLVNFGSGLDKALSVAVAQTKALQAGQNAANAGRIAGMRFDAQSKFNTAMEAAGPLGDSTLTNAASKEFRQQNLTIDGIANSLNTNAGLKDAEKEANKKPKKTVDEYLEELRKEQAHKSSLVGLSKEAIKQSEFEFKLRNKISTLEGETSEAKVIAVLREQEALEKAAEKQKERMQQEQTYSSILANSLESVVQGTLSVEDAFKSMLRNIVMEIYKTNIVEPFADKGASLITSLISSAFGGGPQVGAPTSSLRPKVRSADGNVFTKVNAYASGGVVSSPTTFPMSGGQTGLMGEAGAEAIMPLKRGRNGKLGVQAEGSSGDVININQSFNFQSNGDDTIKSLIAQAAPKIAQMTKASMLDDRRRGGRTKAAFG